MKQSFSLFLAILTILSVFVSCSNNEVDTLSETIESNTVESSTETETVDERILIPDNLPEMTFEGRSYRLLQNESANSGFKDCAFAEDLTGEGVNDAVYNRNVRIEDRFNVTIEDVSIPGDVMDALAKTVNAGTSDYDTFYNGAVGTGMLVKNNYFINLNNLDYIDFNQPWWNPSTANDLTVNDVCFLAIGDSVMSSIAYTYCVVYDKVAAENHQLEDPYEVVKDGRWTIDYVKKMAEQVAQDLDGNGTWDLNDYYGFAVTNGSPANTFLWSFGLKIYTRQPNGEMKYTFFSERTIDCMNTLVDFYLGNHKGIRANKEVNAENDISTFINQKTLFARASVDQLTQLGDYENEYGVIPYPKYDEMQEDYYSMSDGGHSAIGVPNSPLDYDFVGIMIEAICAETYKTVTPAYLDVCLKTRYSSSPEDAEMIDLCVRNCVFDFGYIYDAWNGVSFVPQTLVKSNKSDFASYYAKLKKIVEKHYNSVFDYFMEYDD